MSHAQSKRMPKLRGDAYCFAKVKQDEPSPIIGQTFGIPYVLVRPGYVYGPGKDALNGLVGTGNLRHLSASWRSSKIPFNLCR